MTPRTALAGLCLTAAGLAIGVGQVLRWTPCLGGYETTTCLDVQGNTLDYLLPTDPWTITPGAAVFEGAAHLLIAAGLAVGATRCVTRPVGRVLWAVLLGLLVLVGGLTLVSGVTGDTLAVNGPVHQVWSIGGFVVLGAVAVLMIVDPGGDRAKPLFAAVLVALAMTMSEYFVFSAFYRSDDTPPWTGSIRAVLMVGLGIAIAVVALRPVGAGGHRWVEASSDGSGGGAGAAGRL